MLRLSKIKKNYKVADSTVHALKGIDLSFRKNEFVSILGPSGCGKTTLLNIVGGLDKYTSGDLFINGRSTKEFKDRDWDVYRNHRVGFIFQSYNLIPHQSILSNVELALTISGMDRKERVRKAKQALDKVGLKGQYNKKPNQLSGGQCQRVAIARALVNDPEILLADEPTGALDTVTSVQIMELIKEIAQDRLVIMVTHNPDLAEEYSTRIIKLLDGEVVDDTNPFTKEEEIEEVKELKKIQEEQEQQKIAKEERAKKSKKKRKVKKEKAKMSFWTAFKLSLQNLFSKKARTIMTSIAGAIGIIGVSLVLSISYGVKSFINNMQNDMLSGNPIKISQTAMDMNALMQESSNSDKVKALKEYGFINVDSMIDYLISRTDQMDNLMLKNEITQDYVDYVLAMPDEDVASIFLDYGLDVTNNIYTDFYNKKTESARNISLSSILNIYTSVLKETDYGDYASLITTMSESFMQAPKDEDYILSQYNKLYGQVATQKDEIMIVVNDESELTDLLLAQLGYYSQEEFLNLVWEATEDETKYKEELEKNRFSYEELIGKSFTYYPNNTVYTPTTNPYTPFTYNYNSESFSGGMDLKIVGILEPKKNLAYGCLSSGFYYTEELAKYIIETNINSQLSTYLNSNGGSIPSFIVDEFQKGIVYEYTYIFENVLKTAKGCVGSIDMMMSMIGSMGEALGNPSKTPEQYVLTLQQVGGINLPSAISVYPTDFEHKNAVLKYLDKWNSDEDIVVNGKTLTAEQRNDITYTDMISLIISMVNDFIDIVTYALIGFTALSLLVSCVMIAIITYVSVVERTKEIGVIRSLGGRKRDVSRLFTAETFIIGFCSGLFGIAVTYLVSFIINLIVGPLIAGASIAIFPWHYALIMIGISVLLTVLSGLIPSRSAAKKDPVVALRTE